MKDVVIIGGGIAGLYSGYLLNKNQINYEVYYEEIGGRIQTINIDGIDNHQDMGAEYFLDFDTTLMNLIAELNLEIEEIGADLIKNHDYYVDLDDRKIKKRGTTMHKSNFIVPISYIFVSYRISVSYTNRYILSNS